MQQNGSTQKKAKVLVLILPTAVDPLLSSPLESEHMCYVVESMVVC